jgi:superfamily II DNA or RNA helicase
VEAGRRIAGAIQAFGGALLSDAVGLGKTYVALAVSTGYRRVTAVVPAALRGQWARAAASCGVSPTLVSHEALSRGRCLAPTDLVIVDEAHRFRNEKSCRYDQLCRGVGRADVLLVTATPVVNRPDDLLSLISLFLPDDGLAFLGVRSLERARRDRDHSAISRAAAAFTVARTHAVLPSDSRVPRAEDRLVVQAAPVADAALDELVRSVDALELPAFAAGETAALLRLHLLHRLSSSLAALGQTAARHLAYLDRAITWAEGGAALTRGDARRLFGPGDELQFELPLVEPVTARTQSDARALLGALRRDRRRLLRLATRCRELAEAPNPKVDALERWLAERVGRKTLVFTTARATALDLARALGWRHIGVVTGGRARIGSGSLPVETALGLFAPRARGVARPSRSSSQISTLIATDFASEGLDLQDADAVVHYDLPWTPLTLAQRLGRIVRLGARHETAAVAWFLPPERLDRRLAVERRLAGKVSTQLQLAVPLTSSVGRALVVNATTRSRERLFQGGTPFAAGSGDPRFAVVRGPPAAAVAVRWQIRASEVRELIVFEPPSIALLSEPSQADRIIARLGTAPEITAAPLDALVRPLLALVRNRIRLASLGPGDPNTKRLKRRAMRLGRAAAAARRLAALDALDGVLDALAAGLRAGQLRTLEDALQPPLRPRLIRSWLAAQRDTRERAIPGAWITAGLFGGGTDARLPEPLPALHLR